jgi:ubiquitin-protein ligase
MCNRHKYSTHTISILTMSEKIVTVSKDTIKRLVNDIKTIITCPLTDHGIYYYHDEDDIMKGYALIVGPEDTPYFGGFYFFEVNFPIDYPHSPPVVLYKTNGDNVRFNPNLYVNEKVCISLLNTWRGEQWTSCQTLSTILLNLCTLLTNNPLLNEPGIGPKHPDINTYNRIIEYKNVDIAMLRMLRKPPPQFEGFSSFMNQHFLKNHEKVLAFLEKRKEEYPVPEVIPVNIYSMLICINYEKILDNYLHVYERVKK